MIDCSRAISIEKQISSEIVLTFLEEGGVGEGKGKPAAVVITSLNVNTDV